jgi:glycosyltransferase involved in cell wall biosynthesis
VNVLLLLRDLAYHGGVPQSFLTLAQFRDPARLRMQVGAFRECQPEMVEALGNFGTPVHHLSGRGCLRPALAVRSLLREQHIDAVVCASFKSYLTAKLATCARKQRCLFWIASVPKVIAGPVRRAIYRTLARQDALIFISQAVRKAHAYPQHRGLEQVVYYGITDPYEHREHEPYPRQARMEILGLPPTAFVLGFIAEFIAWKDHPTLISAFAKVADAFPEAVLLLIGTGAQRGELEALARNLACHDRIHFLGPRPDARRLLGLLDAYVHPSRGEGFGLAVVEAMLAGVPVIVSNEGAFPEYVKDHHTGLVVGGGDTDGLARALRELMTQPELARQLAAAGRVHCLKHFSPVRFASEMTAVLERVIAVRPPHHGPQT